MNIHKVAEQWNRERWSASTSCWTCSKRLSMHCRCTWKISTLADCLAISTWAIRNSVGVLFAVVGTKPSPNTIRIYQNGRKQLAIFYTCTYAIESLNRTGCKLRIQKVQIIWTWIKPFEWYATHVTENGFELNERRAYSNQDQHYRSLFVLIRHDVLEIRKSTNYSHQKVNVFQIENEVQNDLLESQKNKSRNSFRLPFDEIAFEINNISLFLFFKPSLCWIALIRRGKKVFSHLFRNDHIEMRGAFYHFYFIELCFFSSFPLQRVLIITVFTHNFTPFMHWPKTIRW